MRVKILNTIIAITSLLQSVLSVERTLVLLDDWHYKETHSLFWSQIRKLGIEIDFKMVDDESVQLSVFGEYIYSSVIFFAPSFSDDLAKKSDLKLSNILKFIDNGHDIMVFANSEVGNYIRKLANEFGVDFDEYVKILTVGYQSQRLSLSPSI